ncbi:hypothetical protein BJ973_004055 [Actinoplanes tereljensis]|uniref:Uncharacterized protein n=1 Tax=Paractinoplanes tereljensis TaxID=571912 RepID=A0A919NT30_9ACTN|nr:hypothetical protein [Actinoplanes tereljensis]GIF23444.1 hypothetical protein Ate02nite_61740 [Actinoplanes tereljensis]
MHERAGQDGRKADLVETITSAATHTVLGAEHAGLRVVRGRREFDFMVQVQTDPHRMPIENAAVKWPERLSPYATVARLRLPPQTFDSPEQLAFADVLRYNPWHCMPEHKPLGNSNRARRAMYLELAELRQQMNGVPHRELTGKEAFTS